MTERFWDSTDDELVVALRGLSAALRWPEEPDVAASVVASVHDPRGRPRPFLPRLSMPSRRRTVMLIAAAVLVLGAAAFAAKFVIDLGALTITEIPGRPTAIPSATFGAGNLGTPVSLDGAASIAGFTPQLPTALGAPDGVWVDEARVGLDVPALSRRVVTAWRPRTGLPRIHGTPWGAVLMQFDGSVDVAFKTVYSETGRFGHALVDGANAYWTTGDHVLQLISGTEIRSYRVTSSVLMWAHGGFTYRLETTLPRVGATPIAESLP
jgi:hypothetical protein